MPTNARRKLVALPRPKPLKVRHHTVRDLIDPRLLPFFDLAARDPEYLIALGVFAEERLAQLGLRVINE